MDSRHIETRSLRRAFVDKVRPVDRVRPLRAPIAPGWSEAELQRGPSDLLATRKDIPVKILAKGVLSKALTVHAHGFSAAARERIEAAGGTCQLIEG